MNKANAEKLAVLLRQVQSINKVMVETMNKLEVIRDNDADAGPGLVAPAYVVTKFNNDQQALNAGINNLTAASNTLDAAEDWLKRL